MKNLFSAIETTTLPAVPRSKETIKLPVITMPATVPLLRWPRFWIVAPAQLVGGLSEDERRRLIDPASAMTAHIATRLPAAIFNLENAPAPAFSAWLQEIAQSAHGEGLHLPWSRQWTIGEKWRAINTLSESGVVLPLYESIEAAQRALEERGGKA